MAAIVNTTLKTTGASITGTIARASGRSILQTFNTRRVMSSCLLVLPLLPLCCSSDDDGDDNSAAGGASSLVAAASFELPLLFQSSLETPPLAVVSDKAYTAT